MLCVLILYIMSNLIQHKIYKYRMKEKETSNSDQKRIYQNKIKKYENMLLNNSNSENMENKPSLDNYIEQKFKEVMEEMYFDNEGRIENDVYDIYAKDKRATHGIFTKIFDNINDLMGSNTDDILSPDGDPVAFDIRIDPDEKKKLVQNVYIPEPPDIQHIKNNYVPAPHYEETQFLTTETGVPLYNNQDSLKLGVRGPTIMEDFHFRQKMMHFDHEQIPERVVHARGSGAYGTFTCTKDMSEYTIARFLEKVGKETPVFVRFSQVVGSKGSSDVVRDARGFATKFYTEEGNFDIVGNNIPVFFIQDAIKFPDLVHSIKPEPDKEMPQATGAHDNFWDFISLTPEAAHMLMWVISDIGLMRSYRTMEGAGVHSFKFVNKNGKVHYVKFHWKPHLGIQTLSNEISKKISDIDYLRRDLWEAIKRGFFPKWDFMVQLMPIEDENNYDFDPLDPTKIWPEKLFPMIKCGELILNKNPSNFFSEVEQSVFHIGHIVPGIDFSNDPLLQGRLFSYTDTQLNRFHSANFNEIPVNRPLAIVRNNQRDGFNRMRINRGPVNYEPNTRAKGQPLPGEKIKNMHGGGMVISDANQAEGNAENFWRHSKEVSCPFGYGNSKSCIFPTTNEGWKVRAKSPKFQDHFSQATARYLAMNNKQRAHLIKAFVFELGHVESLNIRRNMITYLDKIHPHLAEMVAKNLVLE
ncbi:catalase HPII [Tupanvirus deep ocean]|uniref:Catalase HPII n=2 Tax=Tupanvirus TaxID=2094720 RepID=A0AC62A8C6_9VIRU|nr:catalase HPII [Tupanvirus deep ocean]QKU34031.1 catalase HPII [Tupanvirus deep ocean]